MTRFRALALVASLSFVAAACGGGASATDATAPSASESEPAASESVPASPVIDGVFDTVSGAQIDFGSLEGQDTVLWFWAPW